MEPKSSLLLQSNTEPNSETDQKVSHPHNVFISLLYIQIVMYVTLDLFNSTVQYITVYVQSVKL
jgi:hypothetical protein